MSEVAVRFTEAEARRVTDEVRVEVATLWTRVYDLYRGGAHVALGYESWGAYWQAEFGQSGGRGEQLVRAGRVAAALIEAGSSAPTSDLIARELAPVLRNAPDELADVWERALASTGGQPKAREVRALVEPYRTDRRPQRPTNRAHTRRQRNIVAFGARDARIAAEAAVAGLDAALATEPTPEALREWLGDAETAIRQLTAIAERLQGVLSDRR